MAQQIINTGAVANDGTGDPLRTAFTETNSNFTEIYTAGPVGSNVRIANNTILTINTNGNLVLAPNGVGVVQSNVNIVPNQANVRNLGSSTQRWGTVYAQYVNITNGTIYSGDLTVTGNLSAATVTTPELTVNMIRSDDSTVVNIQDGVEVDGDVLANGNVTADYVLGDGSQLMNISVGNSGAVQFNWQGSLSNQGGTPGDTYSTLQFDSNGMPTLDGTTAYQQRVDYSPYLQVLAPRVESTDFGIVAGPGVTVVGYDDNYNTPRSAYLSVQDQATATQQWDFGILGNGSNAFSIQNRTASTVPLVISTDGTVTASTIITNDISSDDSSFVTIQDGLDVVGDIETHGNVTADYFYGDGSQLLDIPVGNNGAVQVAWLGKFSNQGGTPDDTYSTLQFDSNGMPTLDGTDAYQQRVDYSPYLQVLAPKVESTDFDIVAGPGITVVGYDDNYNTPRSAYLSVQDQANATQQWDFGILGNGSNNYSISDRTNSNTWTFGITGDLSAPGNVSAGNVLTSAEVIASGVIQTGTGFSTGGYLSVNGSTDLHDTNIIGNLSVNTIRSDDSTVVLIQDGVEVNGDAIVNGNVTADYFVGNGSQLVNITANSTQVTYLQGDAGSVQRTVASKFQETASVKDFGAVGDGVTNDTAAITAAITATTSGTLIFPEGSYLINNSTGPFTVSNFQGEMIFLGNAKLLFNTNTQAGIVFSGGSNAKIYNIRIDYVTPPTSRTNAQEGIAFYSTTDTTVTGVYVESSPAAGLLFGQCIRPQVSGVVIESSQADGVHFNNCQDPQIDNLITVSTGDDGLAFVNYASQANYSGGTATNIIIRNSKSRGIAVVGQSNVTVSNFLVDGTASSGILTSYDFTYSTRYPANVIWSDGIVRNAGTVTPLVGNQFGIEYAGVVSVKYNNIKVINSASRGMSGTTTANGLVEASDITVDSATTNDGFNFSGDNISINNLFANNIQGYGIYISNSTNVQATNLKTLNVSRGGGLNRAVWFDVVVQLLVDGIEVIDNQGSATGYIVGSASCTRGSVSSVNFAIANGTGQINPVGSGISYPLTNYGPNSTNILFGTGTISGTGNITAGNIIANNVGNIASINLNGNANTVLYGNGVFAAAAASSSYGNANVATFLAAYGSNTISTSGNITAGNVSTGRITLTNGAVIKDTAVGSVAFGQNAGLTSQGAGAVAIGGSAGQTTQGIYAVAIGTTAGNTTQGIGAVAIGGISAGGNLQGDHAVAIGTSSGSSGQGISAVAIGISAGGTTQGDSAVAIGNSAGYTGQGTYAVAVGSLAGLTNQANNSIILNATGSALDQTTANTFTVAPVRNDVANIGNVMFYNATSKEITYGNVISVAGNITGGNISATNHTGTTVSVTGNITAANFFGNGNTLSNVATRFESSWTVPTGNSTQSFTVATSETYYLWVDCNISNGILVWNATATVTNTNVPVVGAQYAWVYSGGGLPVDFTSIPNQFIGTADTIVRGNVAPSATTNRFDFGINNTSGGNITVRYGWVAIS